ncbi:MAG: (2Fe-2S)-binding protein [Acidobacteria bacterium]|nr:(2Fe-2S)-binding protein [Acidobacteriota bacterium]MBV9474870.1 (2Fe-2S)-binding protein [Acidobacteriota bacterium]
MTIRFSVNGRDEAVDVDGAMPLLWILRDLLGMTGTKFGCGVGVCGACTVLEGDRAVRACQVTAAEAQGKRFTTIEGLSSDGTHPCQRAWLEEDVSQCGYCQAGMIMNACALLRRTPKPSDADIDAALRDSVCRCGTYVRIRRAVHTAAKLGGTK